MWRLRMQLQTIISDKREPSPIQWHGLKAAWQAPELIRGWNASKQARNSGPAAFVIADGFSVMSP